MKRMYNDEIQKIIKKNNRKLSKREINKLADICGWEKIIELYTGQDYHHYQINLYQKDLDYVIEQKNKCKIDKIKKEEDMFKTMNIILPIEKELKM